MYRRYLEAKKTNMSNLKENCFIAFDKNLNKGCTNILLITITIPN